MVRFAGLTSIRHYVVLGAYLGAMAFIVRFVSFAVTGEFDDFRWADVPEALAWLLGTLLGLCLLGAGVGWLAGRFKLNSKER